MKGLCDLHNHSSFSRDASDEPELLIQNAIRCGYDAIGITDHNYWITGRYRQYFEALAGLREKYSEKIRVLIGMEISYTNPDGVLPEDLNGFDYCLFEYFHPHITLREMTAYRKQFSCAFGLPHLDIFEVERKEQIDGVSLLAENDIFWELNVNYDRVHGYRTLSYVEEFMKDPERIERVRAAGLAVSVGYDTHLLADYDSSRVIGACEFLARNGIKIFGLQGT